MDFDLTENTCEICGEVFFTYFTPGLQGADPNYCPFCGVKFTTKNGEMRMEAGTKVVMTQQMIAPLIDNELEEGMCFVYRGTCLDGEVHEFAPDFDQGHNTGFQVPQEIFDDKQFRRQFKIVTDW